MFVVYSDNDSVFITTLEQEEDFLARAILEKWDRDFSNPEKWDRVERVNSYVLVESGEIKVQ